MANEQQRVYVTRHLRFTPPTGDPLPTEAVWFRWGEPPRMRVLLGWQHWERVARKNLFDIEDPPTDLVPDTEVLIETELKSGIETEFPDEKSSLRARLADPDEPLRATESWKATEIHQPSSLANEQALTESVFDDRDTPRAHVGSFEITEGTTSRLASRSTNKTEDTNGNDLAGRRDGGEPIDVRALLDEDPGEQTDLDIAISSTLEPVIGALSGEGWSYDLAADGSQVTLTATFEGAEWDVVIRGNDADSRCRITSIFPAVVPEGDRNELASELLTYNATIDRGAFEFDDNGVVRFRTPVDPDEESVSEAVRENVTTMAEYVDELPH